MKIDQGKGSMKKDISNLGMNLSARRLNRILSILFSEMKDLSDEDRDLPIRWNVIHMYTSSQIAKILALKRGIDPELAGIAAALHDIGVVKTKRHKIMPKQQRDMYMKLLRAIIPNIEVICLKLLKKKQN